MAIEYSVRRSRTVVFDLDDTLYAEADYVESGKQAVRALLAVQMGKSVSDAAMNAPDFLSAIISELGMPVSVKSSLLWIYRLHSPAITLRPGAATLIDALILAGDAFCIVTDGRSLTQRLKISALALAPDAVFISEEVGHEKPETPAFDDIERLFPAERTVYIGDNIAKDFVVPRRKGWLTIGLRHDGRAIHSGHREGCVGSQPEIWCDDFAEIARILLG